MSRHPLSEGPVTLFWRAARCWPSAGLRGGQLAVSSHVLWIVRARLPLRGHRGPGPVRASVFLSQVLARSRGHTCRTLRGTGSVSNATSLSVSARLARNPQSAGWSRHPGWTARGTAGRFRRLEDSGEDHPAGKYVPNARSPSGRPHPVPLANNVDVPLAARFCTVAPFGQWVQTHCP